MTGKTTKPVIGVVGGIGAGKTTVAGEFGKLGCHVIDGDAIGHEILNDRQVKNKVRKHWGQNVFDEQDRINRGALGRIVFSDPAQMAELNRITHPHIRWRMREQIRTAEKSPRVPAAVLDAAVLFEAGWDKMCTHTVFVDADEQTRRRRTEANKGWSRRRWKNGENLQISLDKKRSMCDYTINSSSDESHLPRQVRDVFKQIIRNKGHS